MKTDLAKPVYLDTSAIISLLVEEPTSEKTRKIVSGLDSWFTSTLCVAEAFNVLKRKWLKKEISGEDYLEATHYLILMIKDQRLLIRESNLMNQASLDKAHTLVQKHQIDLVDAQQIVSMKHEFASLAGESKPTLVTIDKGLSEVAKQEGIRVVCISISKGRNK